MATTKTYTLVNGQPADATQVNKNFDDLLAGINADVSATDKVLGRATAGAGPVEEIPCTAAGRALIDDASAAAQIATLGAVGTGDSRLSDARTPVAHTQLKATIPDFPASMPASDVSAWAKAASNVAVPGAFGCNGKTAQGAYPSTAPFGWGNGTIGFQTLGQLTAFVSRVDAIEAALVANGIMY